MKTDVAKVYCDKCGWKLGVASFAEVLEWHNKQCPACNDCIIVNDADALVARGLVMAIGTGIMKMHEPGAPIPEGYTKLELKFDTGKLRK